MDARLSIYATFAASIRSVGTACTLASVGIYLHRRKFVIGDGKRTLALISQQVTIPLFLFTKIIYCNQDWSTDPCPDVTQSLKDVWILLFWPIYVVSIGLIIGIIVAKICSTPKYQIRAVLAACGFGNSTGLPITLLSVVHTSFPSTTDLGRIDPCLFLSVYLLLYPVLQWGIGGWLLAPQDDHKTISISTNIDNEKTTKIMKIDYDSKYKEEIASLLVQQQWHNDDDDDENDVVVATIPINEVQDITTTTIEDGGSDRCSDCIATKLVRRSLVRNVLNNSTTRQWYQYSRRGMTETDASLYMSIQDNLNSYGGGDDGDVGVVVGTPTIDHLSTPPPVTYHSGEGDGITQQQQQQQHYPNYGVLIDMSNSFNNPTSATSNAPVAANEMATPKDRQLHVTRKTLPTGIIIGLDLGREGDDEDDIENQSTDHIVRVEETEPIEAAQVLSRRGRQMAYTVTYPDQQRNQQHSKCNVETTNRQNNGITQNVPIATTIRIEEDNDFYATILKTVKEILSRCLQPPVIGAVLGMIIASIPELRGLFVSLIDRSNDAPLEWLYDGLYSIGQAAVPINMIILGCNLSSSSQYYKKQQEQLQKKQQNDDDQYTTSPLLSTKSMIGIVIGKMFIMPIIGFLSAYIFRTYIWNIPDDIDGSFYLVVMIVFLTPTANNVMVMVELSGSGSKEGIAQVIAYQYMVAPLMLSLTMTVAVGMASKWS